MEAKRVMKGRLPLSVMVILICVVAFTGLLFTEDLRALTGTSLLKLKACTKRDHQVTNSSRAPTAATEAEIDAALEDDSDGDDRAAFDPKKCNLANGRWVFNSSLKPLYTDSSCPYLDLQVSCGKNGRVNDDYLHWEWQPDDCELPRFDPVGFLKKLRGKRLMFAGDSLQRAQWQSLVCLVESQLAPDQKSMHSLSRSLFVFKAKEYNATIEFYWAPFLVESNSDVPIIPDLTKRILRVDAIAKHAQHWLGVDILVFNTYVWWMNGFRIKALWGSFANGEQGFEELDAVIAYRLGLKTWANWVDSYVNPNVTRVFFTTMSPTHMRSEDWHHNGTRCYNETRPIMDRGYWGSGSDKRVMQVVSGVIGRMKVPVTFLNITQLSEYRIDGHVSVYTESQGKVLTEEQKSNPQTYADCIHWCIPGVPDTWNQLLYAYL